MIKHAPSVEKGVVHAIFNVIYKLIIICQRINK